MEKLELKYLERLSQLYPTIAKASTEIINLQAILNLPKGTEHFLTDIHGEYEAFSHVLKKYDSVDNFNAKKVICDISKEDYGNEDHINDVIARLAYKWSIEDGPKQIYFIKMLNEIFEK